MTRRHSIFGFNPLAPMTEQDRITPNNFGISEEQFPKDTVGRLLAICWELLSTFTTISIQYQADR